MIYELTKNGVNINVNFVGGYSEIKTALTNLGTVNLFLASKVLGDEFIGVCGNVKILGETYTVLIFSNLEFEIRESKHDHDSANLDKVGYGVEVYDVYGRVLGGDETPNLEVSQISKIVLKTISEEIK